MRKVVEIAKHGGPGALRLKDAESEALQPGHVRVRVRAAGVNFADLMMRLGLYPEAPPLPFTPGYEVAGEIAEIGEGVAGFAVGDRVLSGTRFGGYATEVVVPGWGVRKIPAKLSFEEAAAIPVNFLTAWIALVEMGRVRSGDRVLVHSAAGGVGTAAVQIAARSGARVTGLVGSPAKTGAVLELGAAEALLTGDWENSWKKSAERPGPSYDLILDAVGGPSLKRSYRALAPCGRVVSFGVSTAVGRKRSLVKMAKLLAGTPLYTPFGLMMQNKGVFGLNLLKLMESPQAQDLLARSMDRVMVGFEQGRFRAVVGRVFPLAEAGAAQEWLQSRKNIGKVVLKAD